MSIHSVISGLRPQQILQQTQVANANADESGAAPEAAQSAGQNVPTGGDAATDTSGGAAQQPTDPLNGTAPARASAATSAPEDQG